MAKAVQERVQVEVNQVLRTSRQPIALMGLYQHVAAAGDEVQNRQNDCVKADEVCEQARVKYQSLHSRVERIERLIEKQRETYRRDMLLEQQKMMDDVAVFRWTPPANSEEEVIHHG